MPLDPSSVGTETAPFEFDYDWRTTVLYALGIGAKREELDYLYEGRGPRVYPTFGVLPTYAPLMELLARSGGDVTRMVHGAQKLRCLRTLPPAGRLTTVGRIAAIYDMKRFAQVVCTTTTRLGGQVVFETEWMLLFTSDGGFGGPHPPRAEAPKIPPDAEPRWLFEDTTLPEQALLYRLSGDTNPLHADPELAARLGFERGPILHGLASYGFIGRAVVQHACQGDPSRLRMLSAHFRKPVWPGDVIRCRGFDLGGGVVGIEVRAGQPGSEGEAVITACHAEVAPTAVAPAEP